MIGLLWLHATDLQQHIHHYSSELTSQWADRWLTTCLLCTYTHPPRLNWECIVAKHKIVQFNCKLQSTPCTPVGNVGIDLPSVHSMFPIKTILYGFNLREDFGFSFVITEEVTGNYSVHSLCYNSSRQTYTIFVEQF